MPRRPPRLIVVTSAVLLAAVVGLWGRSYWREYWSIVYTEDAAWCGGTRLGVVILFHSLGPYAGATSGVFSEPSAGAMNPGPARFMGFGYWRSLGWIVEVPFWSVAIIAAVPLAWTMIARRPRHPPGHCRACGYDLTANASGRCPECGADVAPAPSEVVTG